MMSLCTFMSDDGDHSYHGDDGNRSYHDDDGDHWNHEDRRGMADLFSDKCGARLQLKIYTDWANHYLQRGRHKRLITDLQQDIADGVLLAEVIEAVTGEKVKDIKSKPKNAAQMVDNITNCLAFLSSLGVNVEGLSAKDIKDGNLKAILGLFFSLSRYKQQQKSSKTTGGCVSPAHTSRPPVSAGPLSSSTPQRSAPQSHATSYSGHHSSASSPSRVLQSSPSHSLHSPAHGSPAHAKLQSPTPPSATPSPYSTTSLQTHRVEVKNTEMLSRLPSPFGKPARGAPACTIPGPKLSGGKSGGKYTSSSGVSSGFSSASSQGSVENTRYSGSSIPTACKSNASSRSTSPSNYSSGSSIPQPKVIRSHSLTEKSTHRVVAPASLSSSTSSTASKGATSKLQAPQSKNSMLEKFKFFREKNHNKAAAAPPSSGGTTKPGSRDSSSSIPRSDSSSPCGDSRPATAPPSGGRDISPASHATSPKAAVKALAKKTFSLKKDKKEAASPKLSHKELLQTAEARAATECRIECSSPKPAAKGKPEKEEKQRQKEEKEQQKTKEKQQQQQREKAHKENGKSHKEGRREKEAKEKAAKEERQREEKAAKEERQAEKDAKEKAVAGTRKPRVESSRGKPEAAHERCEVQAVASERTERTSLRYTADKQQQQQQQKADRSADADARGLDSDAPGRAKSSSKIASFVAKPSSPPVALPAKSSLGKARSPSKLDERATPWPPPAGDAMQRSGGGGAPTSSLTSSVTSVTSTGIPKPTAAVKGTSKVTRDELSSSSSSTTSSRDYSKNCGSLTRPSSKDRVESLLQDVKKSEHNIVAKMAMHGSQMKSDHSGSLVTIAMVTPMTHNIMPAGKEVSNVSLSSLVSDSISNVGMGTGMTDSMHSTHSGNSGNSGTNSHSSGDSVIYRPSSCDELFSDTETKKYSGGRTTTTTEQKSSVVATSKLPKRSDSTYSSSSSQGGGGGGGGGGSHRKVETTFDSSDQVITKTVNPEKDQAKMETTFGEDAEETTVNIKPMQPIVRASPYAYMRSLGTLSPGHHHTKLTLSPLRFQDASGTPRLAASRHVLNSQETTKPFSSASAAAAAAAASMKRTVSNSNSVYEADYGSDLEVIDIAEGYMSDGGVLRNNVRGGDDLLSGYISEGGAYNYSSRLQARFQEGMAAVRDMHRGDMSLEDDSFDDTSSISSGISDTIDEISTDDLTGSGSVSSEKTNPTNSLKRVQKSLAQQLVKNQPPLSVGQKSGGGQGGGGGGGPTSYRRGAGDSQQQQQQAGGGGGERTGGSKQGSSGRGPENKQKTGVRSGGGATEASKSSPKPRKKEEGTRSRGGSQENLLSDKVSQKTKEAKQPRSSSSASSAAAEKKPSPADKQKFGFKRPTSATCGGKTPTPPTKVPGSNGSQRSNDIDDACCSEMTQRTNPRANMLSSSYGGQAGVYAATTAGVPGAYGQYSTAFVGGGGQYATGYMSGSSTLDRNTRQRPASPRGDARSQRTLAASPTSGRLFGSSRSLNQPLDTVIGNPHATYSREGSPHGGAPYSRENSPHRSSSPHRLSLVRTQEAYTMGTYIPGAHPDPRGGSAGGAGGAGSRSQSPYMFVRASPSVAVPTRGCMTEAESMESISSASGRDIHTAIQHARNSSLTSARLLMHQREQQAAAAAAGASLLRSESVKSSRSERGFPISLAPSVDDTKSEKCYPSMMRRTDYDWQNQVYVNTKTCNYAGDPCGGGGGGGGGVSPTPSTGSHTSLSRFTYALPPCAGPSGMSISFAGTGVGAAGHGDAARAAAAAANHAQSQYAGGAAMARLSANDDEAYKAAAAAYRNSYSFESPKMSLHPYDFDGRLDEVRPADVLAHGSSVSLVSTSSSIYSTPEEKAAAEIRKLKAELENATDKVTTLSSQLHTQGHVVAAFEQSLSNMTTRLQHLTSAAEQKDTDLCELRRTIGCLKKGHHVRGADVATDKTAARSVSREPSLTRSEPGGRMMRHLSQESMSSACSVSSACSAASGQSENNESGKKKKKKSWLRSSFSKAFNHRKKNKNGSVSDAEDGVSMMSDGSAPNSPMCVRNNRSGSLKLTHSSSLVFDPEDSESVRDLKKQLRDKEMKLTDIRLDALTSAHQLDQLREQVGKMRDEMMNLKHENNKLQKAMSSGGGSIAGSQMSLNNRHSFDSVDHRLSLSDISATGSGELSIGDGAEKEGRRISVSVSIGGHTDSSKWAHADKQADILIGSIFVSGKTKWELLDNIVRRIFKEYVLRVDPVSNLGLSADAVHSYSIGDVVRCQDADAAPDLLPCGYLVGDNMQIKLSIRGAQQHCVDALAYETLIPKSIVQRYTSLLLEHRRIILCGPSGTGKSYLGQRLAEYLVLRSGKESSPGAIATFNVDHKSNKELRGYLANIAEQCEGAAAADLPTVIILDNLHHVSSLGEVFNGFLNCKYQKCPYIIGTMNQTTCSTTNLQLHHNFRWVLCANHMEPVKGFLSRYLRRRLVEHEISTGQRSNELGRITDWVPKVWNHLNKFLENHSSSDVTIGPRLFLSCPMEVSGAQVWFTDLWNYSIVPYLLEAVREGLQLYGRRVIWEDPTEWVLETYPWTNLRQEPDWPGLLRLRPEDVGHEGQIQAVGASKPATNNSMAADVVDSDPLLNMLMRLQEAANYSSPQSQDSDNVSLDSHSSGVHGEDLMTRGLESTL